MLRNKTGAGLSAFMLSVDCKPQSPPMHKALGTFESKGFLFCMISESSEIKHAAQNMPSFLATFSNILPHRGPGRSNRLRNKRTKAAVIPEIEWMRKLNR